MKTSKIILAFTRLRDGAIEDKALAVAAAMTGNAYFPEPSPTLAAFTAATTRYADALAVSQSGDKVKILLKNDARKELEFVLSNLAHYCSYIAQGNRTILASSGFTLNADTSSPKALPTAENFSVLLGKNSGEVIASITAVPNAKGYLFLYGIPPIAGNAWQHEMHTSSSFVIAGLSAGQVYSFRIGVLGSKGQTVYTEIITKMVV